MPSDDDILSQLEEIDAEQITGTEVPLDEDLDLDFEDEGVPISKPKAAEPEMQIGDGRANRVAAQGLLPAGAKPKATEQTGLTGSEIRIGGPSTPASPKAVDSGSKAKKTQKATPPKAAAVVPPAPQTAKPKDVAAVKEQDDQDYEDPRKPGVAVSNVQEMVLHAKTLRIVADTVVIEPKTVSISSS